MLVTFATIIVVFVAASVFDVLLAVVSLRFYSRAAFIVVFGVAGVFAGTMSYTNGIGIVAKKNEYARWSLIIFIIIIGILFFFLFAKLEGGEYEVAFKAFGVTTALSSWLFARGKIV